MSSVSAFPANPSSDTRTHPSAHTTHNLGSYTGSRHTHILYKTYTADTHTYTKHIHNIYAHGHHVLLQENLGVQFVMKVDSVERNGKPIFNLKPLVEALRAAWAVSSGMALRTGYTPTPEGLLAKETPAEPIGMAV